MDNKTGKNIDFLTHWLKIKQPELDIKVLKNIKCWPITTEHYNRFTINKRNGSKRELVSVNKNLKAIQSDLADYFAKVYSISKYAHAFVSKGPEILSITRQETILVDKLRPKGIVSNALPHTNKRVVISLDLKNFFPTITFPRVIGMLKSAPYKFSNKQAVVIASLICLPKTIDENQGLPQGAPTSPVISNLICRKLDYQLAKISRKYDITYTRYADDLTFSTNNLKRISAEEIVRLATQCVERNGFKVNKEKTKIMFKNQRQMVTGILVNEGLNLPKKQVDALRATLYNLEHTNKNVEDAVLKFWNIKHKQPYNSFVPVGFYNGGYRGRFIKSKNKGIKSHKPISKKEFDEIYALHLLGRIIWFGQIATTAINTPYDLLKRQYISPKQYSRISKYEEMLATFYRISIKFNWSVEHIVLRLANKLPHLQSLVKMNSKFLLENKLVNLESSVKKVPNLLQVHTSSDDLELESLRDKASNLRTDKEKYTEFFDLAPLSLQRVLRVRNRSHINFALNKIKDCVDYGWPDPLKQKILFDQLNTDDLSDLFHKSDDGKGQNVKKLLTDLVRVVRPLLIYLSENIRVKIIKVNRELYDLMREEGEGVCIDLENETSKTEQAVQAIRDLKAEVRLYESHIDNFYSKIVLPAINSSETSDIVDIDKEDMNPRIVTDIYAWREALTKVLISIKQHIDKSENIDNSLGKKPFLIKLRDENPINNLPRAIEIYRLNVKLPFKAKLEIDTNSANGKVMKWLTGGDLSSAVKRFLPVGDIYVHGNFRDCDNITVNLTEHFYKINSELEVNSYGKLFFSLQEVKE